MSAQHTPGPWSVPHFTEPETNCECGYVLTDIYMGAVCKVYASGEGDDWQGRGDNPKFEEACANARLIAAAPELFRAVELFLAYDSGDEENGVALMLAYNEALTAAQAAYAKARGHD